MAANSILSSFELTASNKVGFVDKATERRNKLLQSLNEQKRSALAAMEGKQYFGEKRTMWIDEDGEKHYSTSQKRVKQWFYTNDGDEWYMEVRYGNKPLQLAKGKTAIVVGAIDQLAAVIDKVIEAVKAKELDAAIEAVVKDRVAARKGRKVA